MVHNLITIIVDNFITFSFGSLKDYGELNKTVFTNNSVKSAEVCIGNVYIYKKSTQGHNQLFISGGQFS